MQDSSYRSWGSIISVTTTSYNKMLMPYWWICSSVVEYRLNVGGHRFESYHIMLLGNIYFNNNLYRGIANLNYKEPLLQ